MKRTHDQFKNVHFTAGVLAIAGCFLMVVFPEITRKAVVSGIDLFIGSVFPAMFPFFVLANFLGMTDLPDRIARLLGSIYGRIFHVSGFGAYVHIISVFSGYPMAAKMVGELRRKDRITISDGKKILSFSCICGPLFMTGTVGAVMFDDPIFGYLLMTGHYLGAVLNGLLWSRIILTQDDPVLLQRGTLLSGHHRSTSIFSELSGAILRAFSSMGLILGYIVLFSVLSEYLILSGLLSVIDVEWLRTLLMGGLEMTLGCYEASSCLGLSPEIRLALCALTIGFGGGSIAGQSLSMLDGSGISAGYYMKMKVSHGILSGILTYYLFLIAERFGLSAITVSVVYGPFPPWIQSLGKVYPLIFQVRSMILLVILMIVLAGLDRLFHGHINKISTYAEGRKKDV